MNLTGGTIDVTVHEMLEDGLVRELYKATGGAWGGNKVNEAFVKYFCDIFSEKVIDTVREQSPSDWADMMRDFEQIKRKISLKNTDEIFRIMLRPCIKEVYLEIMNASLQSLFNGDSDFKTKGASLDRYKLQIPRVVISEMIENVAQNISAHTTFLLQQEENARINFIVMVGGFSNSPIVVEEIRRHVPSFTPVIVPENPELSVVQGAVSFGWKPQMFKSRKSKRTYGVRMRERFRDYIDPIRSMVYDDDGVKMCKMRFDKLITVNEDIGVDQIVKRSYFPGVHNQISAAISIYESEESDVSYCDEPGTRKLGTIKVPMTDLTGDKERKVEIEVRFGGTEFFVSCKDVTTGVVVSDKYDFL